VARDATFAELGDIVAGKAKGRPSPDAITISDLTGTGVQDTAIATLARERTEAAKAGTVIES
jgi:ornithine cyclodeaminase